MINPVFLAFFSFLMCLGHFSFAAETERSLLTLTPEEQAYLHKTPAIKMCVDPDWVPFERINEQGQHEGIAADLIQLVAHRIGLKIELYPVKDWEESLAASKSGRCQIMSFLNKSPARDKWLNFTDPIFFDPNVFITREEHPFIADPHSLHQETIALPRGTFVEERIRSDYPNIKVVTTPNEQEAIALVSERKADMTMRSLIVAAYEIKKKGWFNLKISGQIPEYSNKLRIGVIKSEPVLLSILNKGVQTLTPQERDSISNRHVSIQAQMAMDYALIWKILAGAGVLFLMGVYWNRRLAYFNAQIKRAHYQTQILLDHSDQGFLSFHSTQRINPTYSAQCLHFFGADFTQIPISTLLYSASPEKVMQFKENLDRIFQTADPFKQELLISLLPSVFEIQGKTLQAHYQRLETGEMMMVFTDITAQLALEAQIQEERSRLRWIISVFKEFEDIQSILVDFKAFLKQPPSCFTHETYARELHTWKGLFAQFHFEHLPAVLHEVEGASSYSDSIPPRLYAALEADLMQLKALVGYEMFGAHARIPIEASALAALETALPTLTLPEIQHHLRHLRDKPLGDLLATYSDYCTALAARLGKTLAPVVIEGDRILVNPQRMAPLIRSLAHLFRNALDHGLESPEEREAAEKEEEGHLRCLFKQTADSMILSISDDGRGIDVAALQEKALQQGLSLPENPLEFIFETGLSTRDTVSSLSGRGVGLGAVRAAVHQLGGRLEVHSTVGQGTTFTMTLPLEVD